MRNVIALRAGAALDRAYPGPHRDKLIARDLNVSVRMVQHLRTGQHWTLDRLAQVSALLGVVFDRALYMPASSNQHNLEMSDIAERLARLEEWRGEMVRGSDAGLASAQGGRIHEPGRADPLGPRGWPSDRAGIAAEGAPAQTEGGTLASPIREVRRDVAVVARRPLTKAARSSDGSGE